MSAIIDYRGKSPSKTFAGVPLVTAKIVKSGFIQEPEEFISQQDYHAWMRRGIPKAGDVIMTTEAPLGEVAQLDNRKVALAQRIITMRGNPELLDNTFLKFLLQSAHVRDQLEARSTGTTVLGIRQSELRKILLPLPQIPEQQAIAHMLGTLDDKIQLNRQMNKTLESIARAIFRSWFVDFETIPGMGPHKEWEDSLLGRIPRGWRVLELHDCVASIIDYRGKTPTKLGNSWSSFGIPAISAKNIKKGRLTKKESMNLVSPELFDLWMKDKLSLGDILMTSEAPLGELLYLSRNANFCLSQRVFGIRTKASVCDSSYLYHWLATDEAQSQLDSRATGTTVSGIRQSELRKIKVMAPTIDVQYTAARHFKPILEMIDLNEETSETLASLRDTLLPKLLSGEIRIKDADKIVSHVV
ncbi:MAG: restriction endonuclease subunit S [Desulfomonilaceae bacterium]